MRISNQNKIYGYIGKFLSQIAIPVHHTLFTDYYKCCDHAASNVILQGFQESVEDNVKEDLYETIQR
jgi:hypothetical protein